MSLAALAAATSSAFLPSVATNFVMLEQTGQRPLQFAGGFKNGANVLSATLTHLNQCCPRGATSSNDYASCFNRMCREGTADGIRDSPAAPALPYFGLLYDAPSDLILDPPLDLPCTMAAPSPHPQGAGRADLSRWQRAISASTRFSSRPLPGILPPPCWPMQMMLTVTMPPAPANATPQTRT